MGARTFASTEWTLARGGDGSRDLRVYVAANRSGLRRYVVTTAVRFADPEDNHLPLTRTYVAARSQRTGRWILSDHVSVVDTARNLDEALGAAGTSALRFAVAAIDEGRGRELADMPDPELRRRAQLEGDLVSTLGGSVTAYLLGGLTLPLGTLLDEYARRRETRQGGAR